MANYPSSSEQSAYREAAERGVIPEDLKTILNSHLLGELIVPKTVEPWTYEDDG